MAHSFTSTRTRLCIFSLASVTGDHFFKITELIAQSYKVPSGITLKEEVGYQNSTEDSELQRQQMSDWHWQDYLIDEEVFCHLVELQFSMPRRLFYGWAQYAAGIYEGIKGCRFRWSWVEQGEPLPFVPIYSLMPAPKKMSHQLIGIDPTPV